MTIFNDSSEKQWCKTSAEEKAKARQIYRTCKRSKNKHEVVTANNRIMNAIEVIFFPYDNLDGKSWYFKTDNDFVEISIKAFNKLIDRNKAIKTELLRIKRHLRLMKLSPTERVKAIHDYICENVEYAYEDKARTTLFDAIFTQRVVCCGYSIFFKALCDISKIECECVVNENHEWNRVIIDGKTYFIDATWDDCLGNEKYYMLPPEKFYAIHPMHMGLDRNIWIK